MPPIFNEFLQHNLEEGNREVQKPADGLKTPCTGLFAACSDASACSHIASLQVAHGVCSSSICRTCIRALHSPQVLPFRACCPFSACCKIRTMLTPRPVGILINASGKGFCCWPSHLAPPGPVVDNMMSQFSVECQCMGSRHMQIQSATFNAGSDIMIDFRPLS